MKRLITYISILAVALTATVSCSREDSFDGNQDGVLTLRLQTSEMATRVTINENAGKVNGEGFENTVTHADFFFFKDEAGTTLLNHTRLEVKDGELVPVSGQDNLYEYKFDVTSDGNPLQQASYVYVIANYPDEISATTLEDILDLDIPTDLSGEFESFVMDSYDSETEERLTYLSPSKGHDSKTYTIGLNRIAAKLMLEFTVASSYEDKAGNVWTPVTDQMWWNFLYARKTGMTVEGAPAEFDDKANYYNTAQEENLVATGGVYKTTPVYTYPQKYNTEDFHAPYYKIFCPWTCEKKGMNNFYYKIILPKLPDDSFKRNKIYRLAVNIDVVGGTEEDWALVSDYIFVADWWAPDAIEASFEGAMYLDVPVKEFEIYGLNHITVPVTSSNEIEVEVVSVTQQKVTETTGTSHTHPIRDYDIEENGKESFTLTYNLDGTIDLVTDYTEQNPNNTFDCTPITWVLTVHHKATTDIPYLDKEVTVTITQYPSIYAKLVVGGNSFVNGYYSLQTASVTPKPDSETRYNANNQQSNNGTYYRYQASTNPYSGAGTNARNAQNYGRLNTTVTGKPNTMTLVTVTAFEEGFNTYTVRSDGSDDDEFEYIIGDPRTNSGFGAGSLYNYLNGNNTTAWTAANASKIMISDSMKNVIAPAFMISSDLGGRPGATDGMTYEKALKRCATYQEAGYPAGRWRLPTEAEMFFTYSLQKMYVIGHLYNGGDGYYASSGNVFDWEQSYGGAAGRRLTFQDAKDDTESHSIRCVYDIWYWGPDPDGEIHSYSIMP